MELIDYRVFFYARGVMLLFFLFTGGIPAAVTAQQKTEIRAAAYFIADNNINETPQKQSGIGHQAVLTGHLQYPLFRHRWTLQFRSNNFFYYSHTAKNRTLNQFQTQYLWRLSDGFYLQPLFTGEIKHYLDDPRNYRLLTGGFAAILHTKNNWRFTAEIVRSKKYFPAYRQFNNLSDILTFSVRIPVRTTLRMNLSGFAGNHRYSKNAINYQYHSMPFPQRDNTFGAGSSVDFHSGPWFFMAQYYYQTVFSNSFGSSFSYHKLDGMLLKKITTNVFLKIYGSTQKRHYPDQLASPDISTTLVGSDFQSLIAELGRKTGEQYEIKLRLHWYRNQVLFTDTFYNRTVLSVGIERDF